ncbi:MAG: thiamine pyrophosphate-dependent dehydrogenase E1 component subunit alpha [Planctomycetes bacterium]|nr:thiamine pyrophosphate-dependent dehydrogenase E1 component subunit alpha [Planctomycetota bacterium]
MDGAHEPALAVDTLVRMLKTMILVRCFDERALNLQRSGRIGFHVPSSGQEACQVGAAAALTPRDWVFPSYREPGLFLWRGSALEALYNNLYGNSGDLAKGRQMPVHYTDRAHNVVSISSPIATQLPQAVGVAMAARIRKDPIVVLTGFGDGSTSASDFHVGANFAGVYRAPVVFLCANNQWAISVPFERQTASASVAIKAQAYGFPGVRVDGNDVLAVYQAVRDAAERARRGDGPTLVEAFTFRMGPHSSSDDPKRYRPEALCEEWKKRDPIERFGRYLTKKGLLSEAEVSSAWEAGRQATADAARAAERLPPPPVESLFEDVYAEMPPHLRRQLDELLEERKAGESVNTSQAFPL